ncbi:MAG: DUF952 domain-containing protein [Nocardioides sp.]
MRIFHIATAGDWQAAQATGEYAVSTLGRTLAEEGFIHASRGDQWQGVRERFYSGVSGPLVLLSIDTELLQSPVVDEAVPGTDETFPHIFGPIQVSAVVHVLPLDPLAQPEPASADPVPAESERVSDATAFSRLFLGEVFKQLILASLVLACVVAATLIGQATGLAWGPIVGAAVGLVLGALGARGAARRRAV